MGWPEKVFFYFRGQVEEKIPELLPWGPCAETILLWAGKGVDLI
jgi:hypothetical protein